MSQPVNEFKMKYSPRHKTMLTLIAYAEGYCMVRCRGAAPFVLSLREWLALSPYFDGKE